MKMVLALWAICLLVSCPALGLAEPYWTGIGDEPVILIAPPEDAPLPSIPGAPNPAIHGLYALTTIGVKKVTDRMPTERVVARAKTSLACVGVVNPSTSCRRLIHINKRSELKETLRTLDAGAALIIELQHVPMAEGGFLTADAEYIDLKPKRKSRYSAHAMYSIQIPVGTHRAMIQAKHERFAGARSSEQRHGMFLEYEDYWFAGAPNRWEVAIAAALPELAQMIEAALSMAEADSSHSTSKLWEARKKCKDASAGTFLCGGWGSLPIIHMTDVRLWRAELKSGVSWAKVTSQLKNYEE